MKFLSKTLAALGILAIWSALPLSANSGDDEAAWMANGSSYIVTQASAEDSSPAENAQENKVLTKVKSNFLGRLAELGVTSGSKSLTDDIFSNIFNDVVAIALDPTSKTEVTNSAALTTNMTKETNGRTKLKEKAADIFWWLALIQLGFVMGIEFIGNGLDLQVFVAALIRYFITVGFFWYIVDKGPEIIGSIITYFIDVGDELRGSTDLSGPTACFNMGIDLVYVCIQAACARIGDVSIMDLNFKPLLDALVMAFVCTPCAIVVMITLMYIATTYVIMTFEGYFLVTISCLLLGLGGCRFTWGIVDHILRAMAQMGLKLMTCILLMHGVTKVSLTYMYDIATSTSDMIVMLILCLRLLGACLIFAFLSKSLPSYVASLIPGGNAGGAGVGFIGMMGAAMHTGAAIAHTPGKGVNAVVKGINAGAAMKGDFMHGIHEPSAMGFGALNPQTGKRDPFTMTGAVGALLGGGGRLAGAVGAGAIGAVKAAVRPEGKEADNASSAAVGGGKGITGEADKMSSHESQGNTAGTPKGSLENSDAGGNVGSGNGTGSSVDSSAGSPVSSAASSGANTAAPSGNSAASGTGSSVNSSAGSPVNSAANSGANTAAPSGNSAASGTGSSVNSSAGSPVNSASGAAPNAPQASGNAQKPSGNNAKGAKAKTKTSAKSGEGAVFKGKGKMYEAMGAKKGARPKGDGKE